MLADRFILEMTDDAVVQLIGPLLSQSLKQEIHSNHTLNRQTNKNASPHESSQAAWSQDFMLLIVNGWIVMEKKIRSYSPDYDAVDL